MCPTEAVASGVPTTEGDQLDTESAERSEVRRQRRPNEPTAEEVAAHEEHHEPYRAWCPHCVAGRGRSDKHRQSDHSQDALAVVGMDYGYLGQELEATPLLCASGP